MRRRRKKRSSELTSLVDVLFILLFAALIQARGVAAPEFVTETSGEPDHRAAEGSDAAASAPDASVSSDATSPPDALPSDDAAIGDDGTNSYRARSLRIAGDVASAIGDKPVAVVEIAARGQLEAITFWSNGVEQRRLELSYPLLENVPDFELDYRGNRNPRHQICAIVRDHLDEPARDAGVSSGEMVVLITMDTPPGELPLALSRGLASDGKRCFNGFHGLAIMIQPRRSK